MVDDELMSRCRAVTTAHVADAMVRLGVPVRLAPPSIRALLPGSEVAGPARPVRHHGSVDVFLEALSLATPGEVLLVDNGGRDDEACVGDLMALEAQQAGLAAIVIWGRHRDGRELQEIGLPVFSTGSLPFGPRRLDPRTPESLRSAQLGEHLVTADDVVLGDDDGVVLVPGDRLAETVAAAESIRDTELAQAARMRQGESLRSQTRFSEYLVRRETHGTTFRSHLRRLGGAIEE